MASSHDVTELLADSRDGSAQATEQLLAAVYDELRQMAHSQRSRHRDHETLNTTALVHEIESTLATRDWVKEHGDPELDALLDEEQALPLGGVAAVSVMSPSHWTAGS